MTCFFLALGSWLLLRGPLGFIVMISITTLNSPTASAAAAAADLLVVAFAAACSWQQLAAYVAIALNE